MLLPLWAKIYVSYIASPEALPHTPGAIRHAAETGEAVPSANLSDFIMPFGTSAAPEMYFGS